MKSATHKTILLRKPAAMLFTLVMLFMLGIQTFHHHHEVGDSYTGNYKISFVKDNTPCFVCDQIQHAPNFDLAFPDFTIAAPVTQIPAHGGRYYMGFHKFTLQGFTNKGPPVIFIAA